MIVPAALLQSLGALAAGALFLAIPGAGTWLQRVAPGRNGGDVLAVADYALLLLGSCAGALIVGLVWHSSRAETQNHGSRLLPLD